MMSRRASRRRGFSHPAVLEAMEPRLCLYSQPVHATLTELGIRFFLDQFGPATIEDHIATARQGAFDEDTAGRNPYRDGATVGDANSPSLRHFWGRSRRLGDGLGAFDSAPERAISYVTNSSFANTALFPFGGIVDAYRRGGPDERSVYLLFGHIAHLLEDMNVPAHANNDAHLDLGGPADDPDPYHDWIDGNRVGAGAPRGHRAADYPADPSYKLRRPRDLAPSFVTGGRNTQALVRLFLETANNSSRYASDGVTGTIPDFPFEGAGTLFSSYDDWTPEVLEAQATDLVPYGIHRVGELVRYFYGLIDDQRPLVDLARLESTDPAKPQVVRGSKIDLTTLASDQDRGGSGIAKRLFKVEINRKPLGGSYGGWTTLSDLPEAQDVRGSGFGPGDTDKPALAGLTGVRLGYKIAADTGATYAVRVSVEDGAGNTATSDVYYVTTGGGDVDVAFVIDTTGSMYDDIDNVKRSASEILATLGERNPGARAGVVLYKDFGDSYITRTLVGFTDDLDAVNAAIQNITVDGGGDWPEAVLSALRHAFRSEDGLGDWRGGDVPKQIILFGDAPAHDPERHSGLTSSMIIDEAVTGGFDFETGALRSEFAVGGRTPFIINSIVVNFDSRAIASFRALASGTGGVYVQAASAADVADALSEAIVAAVRPEVSVLGFESIEDYRDGLAYFTLRLSGPSPDPIRVTYRIDGATALAGADFRAEMHGELVIPAGALAARVPVTILADGSDEEIETLALVIETAEGAVVGTATAIGTITSAAFTTATFDASSPLRLRTSSGARVTVRLAGPGVGTAWIPAGGGLQDVRAISVAGTESRSSLSISVAGKKRVSIGDVLVGGALGTFTAPAADVIGGRLAFGVAPRRVVLGDLTDGSILELGAATSGRPTLTLGRVRDSSIVAAGGLASVTLVDWLDTDEVADELKARSIGSLNVTGRTRVARGDFDPDVSLDTAGAAGAALSAVTIAGNITGGSWTIVGRIGTIVGRAMVAGWRLESSGSVGTIRSTVGSLGGEVRASWIGRVESARAISGLAITATGFQGSRRVSIGEVIAGGAISNARVRAAGGIDSVAAARMSGSTIHLGNIDGPFGLDGDGLAGRSNAMLSTLALGASTGATYTDSLIVAPRLGKISLGRVRTGDRPEYYGVAAKRIDSLSLANQAERRSLRGDRTHVTTGDFVAFTT